MLYGLVLHATLIGNNPLFIVIRDISGLFRMDAFFLISGYFTVMLCVRSSYRAFMINRARTLLVPFMAALILLNPLSWWLLQWFHGGGNALVNRDWSRPGTVWHMHLWFLLTLFVYVAVAPLVLKLASSRPVTAALEWMMQRAVAVRMLLLSILVGGCVVALRGFADIVVMPWVPGPLEFVTQRTFNFFAYFAVGMVAYRNRTLFGTLHNVFWPGLILFGAVTYFSPYLVADLPHALQKIIYWFARSALVFNIVCALLKISSLLIKTGSPLLSRMTDGVYTFYIFHFLIIYMIANLVHPFTNNIYLIYVLILIIGYPLLFLIHEKLIAPSPLLTLLFNGKVKPRPVPAS